jgi:hypothetical protein
MVLQTLEHFVCTYVLPVRARVGASYVCVCDGHSIAFGAQKSAQRRATLGGLCEVLHSTIRIFACVLRAV